MQNSSMLPVRTQVICVDASKASCPNMILRFHQVPLLIWAITFGSCYDCLRGGPTCWVWKHCSIVAFRIELPRLLFDAFALTSLPSFLRLCSVCVPDPWWAVTFHVRFMSDFYHFPRFSSRLRSNPFCCSARLWFFPDTCLLLREFLAQLCLC